MKYVFITGMGRSGTKFLSSLLKLDSKIKVFHEDIGDREYWLLSWYLNEEYAIPFLKKEKIRLDTAVDKKIYVDVNSYLQNSVEVLPKVFSNCELFHLVRDPRKVVPSIYTRRDDNRIHKIPKEAREITNWLDMNKLQQVCNNWVQTTNSLIDSGTRLIRFEDMTTDFNYLKENVLDPIGANISIEKYEDFRKIKINRTRGFGYRYLYAKYKGKSFTKNHVKFEDFNSEQKEMFFDICGPTMDKLRYSK